MNDDHLVRRLRDRDWLWTVPGALREEAADRIEALLKRIRELEEECRLLSAAHKRADEGLAQYEKRIGALELALRQTIMQQRSVARRALEVSAIGRRVMGEKDYGR